MALDFKQRSALHRDLQQILAGVYSPVQLKQLLPNLVDVASDNAIGHVMGNWVDQKDVMLITYGDSILEEGVSPLTALKRFLDKHVKEVLSAVHILPCFPYTSDDGFSVVDYWKINPQLGDWNDIHELAEHYDLMLDGVINHISKSSEWFQGYLNGDLQYIDFFTEAKPDRDYSSVTRPRALPLLTPFETSRGVKTYMDNV